MADSYAWLNRLPPDKALATLLGCCAARRWGQRMLERRPFADQAALHRAADEVWGGLEPSDYLEAFAGHPAIGGDVAALKKRYAKDSRAVDWSRAEQSSVDDASAEVLGRLSAANAAYVERFGYVFIVCATGKTASEMLSLLEARLENPAAEELRIGAAEQAKITHLRLDKLAA